MEKEKNKQVVVPSEIVLIEMGGGVRERERERREKKERKRVLGVCSRIRLDSHSTNRDNFPPFDCTFSSSAFRRVL